MKWLFIALGIYAVGCVASLSVHLFARVRDAKRCGSPVAMFFWPVLLFFPFFMLSEAISRRKQRNRSEAARKRFEALIDSAVAVVKEGASFDPTSIDLYCQALTAFKTGDYRKIPSSKLEESLKQFWVFGGEPFDYAGNINKACSAPPPKSLFQNLPPLEAITRYTVSQGWLIAMSHEFIKAIESVDRKLQGRILAALADISKNPITVKGDTVKPLTHEMKGLWRYRLGDYRLVYQPLPEKNQILLVNFDSRGAVYG